MAAPALVRAASITTSLAKLQRFPNRPLRAAVSASSYERGWPCSHGAPVAGLPGHVGGRRAPLLESGRHMHHDLKGEMDVT